MYKLCKTEQSATRQAELERGLLEIMATRHYDEISVSDLCKRMDIPRKSFYRYFSGKDGALHALIDHTLQAYDVAIHGGSKLTQLEDFFRFWQGRRQFLDALERSGLSGVLIERAITQAVADQRGIGQYRTAEEKLALENATMFAICGLMSMMLQWHHTGYPQAARQMAAVAVTILTRPLYPDL